MEKAQISEIRGIVLNALPLNIFGADKLQLEIIRFNSLEELSKWLKQHFPRIKIIHFIRHTSTVRAIRAAGIEIDEKPNDQLYKYETGDLIIVVSLKKPVRGQEVEVTPADLEAWVVRVL